MYFPVHVRSWSVTTHLKLCLFAAIECAGWCSVYCLRFLSCAFWDNICVGVVYFDVDPSAVCFAVGASLLCVCEGGRNRVNVFKLAPRFELMYKFGGPHVANPVFVCSRPMASTLLLFSQDKGTAVECTLRGEVKNKMATAILSGSGEGEEGDADAIERANLDLTACSLVAANFDDDGGADKDLL